MIAEGWLGRFQRRRPHGPVGSRGSRARGPARERRFLRRLRLRPRVIVALLAVLLLLGGGWMWLRDSSLVAVEHVRITGASGPDAGQIRAALESAARNMTTLDVRMDQLRTAVAPYPVVKDLRVTTSFPHEIRISVVEQIPVGAVVIAGRLIAVAGDGTLLHDAVPSGSLPQIPLRVAPGGKRVSDPAALNAVAVLAAAPNGILGQISQVTTVSAHGLVAQVRGGPSIYFGDASRLAAKWTAAVAVLADPGSAGALYIDVTYPERPAAGPGSGSSDTSSSSGTSSSTSIGSGATGSTGASSSGSTDTGGSASASSGSAGTASSGSAGTASSGSAGTGSAAASGTSGTPSGG